MIWTLINDEEADFSAGFLMGDNGLTACGFGLAGLEGSGVRVTGGDAFGVFFGLGYGIWDMELDVGDFVV